MYTQKKKSRGIKSGERGGQVVGDLRSLSLPHGSEESLRFVGPSSNLGVDNISSISRYTVTFGSINKNGPNKFCLVKARNAFNFGLSLVSICDFMKIFAASNNLLSRLVFPE
jgi:hypothetical protein